LGIAMRLVFYLLRKLLLIFLVVLLAGTTFFATRDVANVFIVVSEGLKNRTAAILEQDVDVEFLGRFFSDSFLREDELINNNVYKDYNIYSYRQRVRSSIFWIWPWSNHAEVYVEHIVSDLIGEPKNISEGLKTPPAWKSGRKVIMLERDMGRWQINEMRLVQ